MFFKKTPFLKPKQRKNLAILEHYFCTEYPLRWFKMQEQRRKFTEYAQLFRLEANEQLIKTILGQNPEIPSGFEIAYSARDQKSNQDVYVIRPKMGTQFKIGELTNEATD